MSSFACPKCESGMDVKDSRPARYLTGITIRRRRRCTGCGFRMTTVELPSEVVARRGMFISGVRVMRRIQDDARLMSEMFEDLAKVSETTEGDSNVGQTE